jgi:hypothetical protein
MRVRTIKALVYELATGGRLTIPDNYWEWRRLERLARLGLVERAVVGPTYTLPKPWTTGFYDLTPAGWRLAADYWPYELVPPIEGVIVHDYLSMPEAD